MACLGEIPPPSFRLGFARLGMGTHEHEQDYIEVALHPSPPPTRERAMPLESLSDLGKSRRRLSFIDLNRSVISPLSLHPRHAINNLPLYHNR